MKSYNDYSKTHELYSKKDFDYDTKKKQLDIELHGFIDNYSKNIAILDIGCGIGIFAYYCKNKGFIDYKGIDPDTTAIKRCQEKFLGYEFYNAEGIKFLEKENQKFDLIFMSHVLEHLSVTEGERLICLIKKSLSKNGKFINIMPNADALFGAGTLRYGDLTHKTLYNTRSFNQHLLKYFKYENITHINNKLSNNMIIRLFHNVSLIFYKIYLYSLGFRIPKVYSQDIITIVTK